MAPAPATVARRIPHTNSTARSRLSHWLATPRGVAVLLFCGAALARGALATQMVFPPLGDAAYYIAVARSLYAGRGFTIGNVWNYQPPPASVVGPSNSYWGPLPSIAEWLSMLVFGDRLFVALIPGILAGALLVALTYWWGRDVFARWLARGDEARTPDATARAAHWLALGAALLLAASSLLTYQSVMGDSSMLYGILGFTAIVLWSRALMPSGREDAAPRLWWDRAWWVVGATPRAVLAGALLGLAYLTRGSAIFLAAALGGWWLWRVWQARKAQEPAGRRNLFGAALAFAAGALVATAPWLVRQQIVFGHMFSSEATHNALAFSLADFFDYGPSPTLASLLSHGWGALLALRVDAFGDAWHRTTDYLLYPTALPAVAGLCVLARRVGLAALGLAAFALLLLGFVLLFPAVSLFGGYYHSVASVAPFLAWGELALIFVAARWARQHLPLRVHLAPALLAIPLLLQIALLAFAFPVIGAGAQDERRVFGEMTVWLRAHHARVVMATESTSLYFASGIPTIELPAAQSPDVAYACARRYGAEYLVIAEQDGLYPQALRDHPNAHFVLVEHQSAFDVYQIIA